MTTPVPAEYGKYDHQLIIKKSGTMRIKSLLATFFLLVSVMVSSQNYRYVNTIFPTVTKTSDVVYGSAPFLNSPYSNETSTSTGNLVLDIYRPSGDPLTNRPAIIFAHGGGFVTGNRNHNDMVAFCDTFASKGYVTATIDYRQGVYTYADAEMHYTRAVYRGTQDGRSAVRFLRANAATYGIDPDKIYLVGSSAGGFIGLHDIYMDDPGEKPAYAGTTTYGIYPPITAPDLGAYDIGNNLTFNGEPDAIVSLWGAVASPDLITSDDNQPVLLVHGTADVIVPFNTGHPFQVPAFPLTYGSNQVNIKLDALGLTNNMTYFVEGQEHEFYGVTNGMWNNGTGGNAYWDTIVKRTTTFFHKVHKPTAAYSFLVNNETVNFTDQSTGAVSWHWNFGDGSTSVLQNPVHTYTSYGTYNVNLYIQNNISSWDTLTHTVIMNPVPVNRTVTSLVIHNNETECFDATEVVTVSNFTVETGGNATLIAGGQIHFTPGILVQPGGSMHGYITTTEAYCTSPSSSVPDALMGEVEPPPVARESWFKLSPNPTSGEFTLDLTGCGTPAEVRVDIYGMHGEKILQALLHQENRKTFCIGNVPSGIYIMRIRAGDETVSRKLVKM
jgi:acetyl esterase/lipase